MAWRVLHWSRLYTTHQTMSTSAAPETRTYASHLQPVPPDPELLAMAEKVVPSCYRVGDKIVVENGGNPPVEYCIKSGRPARKVVSTSLRNPLNPTTWFGKCPRIEIGLSRKQYDSYLVARALTWSFLGIGLVILLAGIVSLSWVSCFVGLLATGISGVFRATSPVTSRNATEEYADIQGASASFLKHLESRA